MAIHLTQHDLMRSFFHFPIPFLFSFPFSLFLLYCSNQVPYMSGSVSEFSFLFHQSISSFILKVFNCSLRSLEIQQYKTFRFVFFCNIILVIPGFLKIVLNRQAFETSHILKQTLVLCAKYWENKDEPEIVTYFF